MDIKLPDLGDGIESGDVINVLVKEGDRVAKDQGLIELETDKASVEIPTTEAGVVTKIYVKSGSTLAVGGPIVSIEPAGSAPPSPADSEGPAAAPVEAAPSSQAGNGAAAAPVQPSAPAPQPPASAPKPADSPQPAPTTVSAAAPAPAGRSTARASDEAVVAAGPAMRRFAREVGVDLQAVTGTGEGGRITRGDILKVVREGNAGAAVAAPPPPASTVAAPAPPAPQPAAPAPSQPAESAPAAEEPEAEAGPADAGESSRDNWGQVRIEKMPKIRRTIANKMHESWSSIPRVTNFDDADVTEAEKVRQSSKADYAAAGIKLTSMPFVIKACAMALRANPVINASIDVEKGEIIYKDYVNIGIAVDTSRGLIVPSLRRADRLSIPDIARQLADLAEKVRAGDFGVEDLRGSTFTISNLGAIGGTYSTPIINPPEAATLLVGRARKMPVVVDHQFAVRLLMPLSISYDHRLIDGAAAARFLNDVKSFLQSPSRLLLAP